MHTITIYDDTSQNCYFQEDSMNKKVVIAGIGAVVILAAGAGFFLKSNNKGGGQGGPGGGMGGMQQDSNVTIVKAANPTTGDVYVTSGLAGTVEAADLVYVYAKAGGDVTAVNVKAGDTVEQGQVLLEINTEQVESAKNSLDSAEVSYNQAQSNLNRMKILYDGGDLSEQEYEQYQNNLKSAQLQYENAKINYQKQVDYSTITAPISGRIESCDVEVYDRVNQNNQLCVIAGTGESRITFYVTQRMMNNLREGDELEVVKNGTTYKGWITEISTMVDSTTGLFKVKAALEETDEIAVGSTVKINLVTDRSENVMLVPVNAIYYSGGDGFVYLYEDGVAKMTPVEVGLYDDENAEIISGITADDMVVSTWSSNLYEGAKIRLLGDTSEESSQEGQGGPDGAEGGQGGPGQGGERPAQ
jgi:RND family efflux transporter MFP subunit